MEMEKMMRRGRRGIGSGRLGRRFVFVFGFFGFLVFGWRGKGEGCMG